MSVSKPLLINNTFSLPIPPDFWENFVECDVPCYICGKKNGKYVRSFGLNFCDDPCVEKYLKIPKPSMIYLQCERDEKKIPKEIMSDALSMIKIVESSLNQKKIPVFYYSGEKLVGFKQYADSTGTFPIAFFDEDMKLNDYKYAWGFRENTSGAAEWLIIPMDTDLAYDIVNKTITLYDMYDLKTKIETFTIIIFNKYKV